MQFVFKVANLQHTLRQDHHFPCNIVTRQIGQLTQRYLIVVRVYGIRGLRVVDASVLPKIPGFFIVTSVYMIAEKAADVMLGR